MTEHRRIGITEVVLRDAHQSLLATRMRTRDMLAIAKKLDSVGYWSIECWGGATFDSCIRFLREDPWERIRELRKAMPNTRLQMLLRGQNLLGYRNYADDVVDAFVERAAANGVDIFRVFDALNDVRNLERAVTAVKAAGKHAQGTISYTVSPFHTNEGFIENAISLEGMGCDSICIKDMAGLLSPTEGFNLVAGMKANVRIPVSVHSHATTGMATTTLVKAIEAGCDMVDTAISSLSLGTSHPPTETIVAMLSRTPYDTGLNLDLLAEIAEHFRGIRQNYSEFESSFASADARILTSQIPGGMLSNLESQLRQQKALDKIDEVMREIPKVRKELGYPPLVTPTSQIVGTQAVLNVLQGERYATITAETKALLAGRYGRTPAPVDREIQRKALGREEPIEARPADLIEPELERLKKEIGPKAKSLEDVLTYALFPKVAPGFFEAREKGVAPAEEKSDATNPSAGPEARAASSAMYTVVVDGVPYNVAVHDGESIGPSEMRIAKTHLQTEGVPQEQGVEVVSAPLAGRVLRIVRQPGSRVEAGETVMVIEAMKMETEIKASESGSVHRHFVSEGVEFAQGQPLYALRRQGRE
ncbi:MAG: sodium-extruding oxaloacetate decarboxylase subunit alpha [Proteobacteria bacterium]|nr:sodium-extruding oxaloacetate decarboxylase subunit alpha [Pseudomonadota bacterium]